MTRRAIPPKGTLTLTHTHIHTHTYTHLHTHTHTHTHSHTHIMQENLFTIITLSLFRSFSFFSSTKYTQLPFFLPPLSFFPSSFLPFFLSSHSLSPSTHPSHFSQIHLATRFIAMLIVKSLLALMPGKNKEQSISPLPHTHTIEKGNSA